MGKEYLEFTVYGTPVAQGRGRIVKRGPHYGIADPEPARKYKDDVRLQALEHRREPLWEGPVYLTIDFTFPRPKSARKEVFWKTTKPDLDNLIKAVTDALQGIVYKSDAQIVSLFASKSLEMAPGLKVPGVRISLTHDKEEGICQGKTSSLP